MESICHSGRDPESIFFMDSCLRGNDADRKATVFASQTRYLFIVSRRKNALSFSSSARVVPLKGLAPDLRDAEHRTPGARYICRVTNDYISSS
jgi:hypothetical protein